jgi:hypothetical protein
MDTIVLAAILLLLAVPFVEIAVKRPGIFLELARDRDSRAFAEAPLRKITSSKAVASHCAVEIPRSDENRLAA